MNLVKFFNVLVFFISFFISSTGSIFLKVGKQYV